MANFSPTKTTQGGPRTLSERPRGHKRVPPESPGQGITWKRVLSLAGPYSLSLIDSRNCALENRQHMADNVLILTCELQAGRRRSDAGHPETQNGKQMGGLLDLKRTK
jgi:hypothetical protein